MNQEEDEKCCKGGTASALKEGFIELSVAVLNV